MWREFCIQYARSVAFKFAESWRHYSTNVQHTGGADVPAAHVVQQFTDALSQQLTERLQTSQCDTAQGPNRTVRAPSHEHMSNVIANSYRERLGGGWRFLNEYGNPAVVASGGGSWLTRSRSEVASRGSSFLADSMRSYQCATATAAAAAGPVARAALHPTRPSSKRLSWFRSHFTAKSSVQLVKEGNVRYTSGLELEAKQWRKCRLCLVKTADTYLLQFFSPPKSSKAKSGIFCFLIMEVREATPLEFGEGNESIFVIRDCNDTEYVIEARNCEDCQQWLSVIRSCMPLNNRNFPHMFVRQPSAPPCGSTLLGSSRKSFSTRSLNHIHATNTNSSTNMMETTGARFMNSSFHGGGGGDVGVIGGVGVSVSETLPPGLETYPWFHARLSRSTSARLVLHNGVHGHGLFLIRQSETRPGEFVLTFNCHGKAKHVRIAVMPDGECRIHQMIFESMIDLLEYFRDNPIPLDNPSTPPMLLNEYVICWRRRSLASLDLDVRDFLTYAGMVRLDIQALEELVRREQHERRRRAMQTASSLCGKNAQ